MHKAPPARSTDRLARFLERANGLRRPELERIVDHLIDRLETIDRSEAWREAA